MTNITILSDYGLKDHFVAALKGMLLREVENPRFIDISHEVPLFNLREAAYILLNSYRHFPEGTIHLICVDEEPDSERSMLVIEFEGHFFIGVNNGLMGLILQGREDYKAIRVDENLMEGAESARDIFAKIAGHLSRGGKASVLGRTCEDLVKLQWPNPTTPANESSLSGVVMYIDHFGNAVTNISKLKFEEFGHGRPFEIRLTGWRHPITKIHDSYADSGSPGSTVALFNASGLLEIAIYKPRGKFNNGAHTLLGLNLEDRITITFK